MNEKIKEYFKKYNGGYISETLKDNFNKKELKYLNDVGLIDDYDYRKSIYGK